MKKLLLILLLLPAWAMAQQAQPVSPVQVPQTTLYNEPSTGTRWWYNGATLGWYPIYPYTPPNTVLTGLSMTVVSSTLTVHTGTWRINNAVYTLSGNTNFTLRARDSVYSRYETVYATKANNGIGIKVGVLSPTPIQPTVGTDTLFVGAVLITPTATVVIPPGPSNEFVFSIPGVQQSYANPWVRTLRADTIKVGGHYILPPIDGTSGQVLQTNGAGYTFWSNQAIYLPLYPVTISANNIGVDTTGKTRGLVTHTALMDTLTKNAAHFNPTQFTISNDTISLIGGGGGNTIYTANDTITSNRTIYGHNNYLIFDMSKPGSPAYSQFRLYDGNLIAYMDGYVDTTYSQFDMDTTSFYLRSVNENTNILYGVKGNTNYVRVGKTTSGTGYFTGLSAIGSFQGLLISDQNGHRGIVEDSTNVNEHNYTDYNYVTKRWVDSAITIPSYTFNNGITNTAGTVQLGGALTKNTTIDGSSTFHYTLTFANADMNIDGLTVGKGHNRYGDNTAFGTSALASATAGSNVAIGASALTASTSGTGNVAVGNEALIGLKIGTNNIAIGNFALAYLSTGTSANNTAVGAGALEVTTTGNNNTAIGVGAGGVSSTMGDGNVFIGVNSGANETGSGKLYIANTNTTTPLIKGDFSAETLQIYGTLTSWTPTGTAGTDSVMVKDHTTGVYKAISPTYYGTGAGTGVSSVSNSDGSLTISPTTGAVVGSIALGHGNVFTTAQTVNTANITTTSTDGLVLENTTASTAGTTLQYSARSHYVAHVWNTTVTAADNYAEWIQEGRGVSGGSPQATLYWASRVSSSGSGSFTDQMSLNSFSGLTVVQKITSNTSFNTAGLFYASGAGSSGNGYYLNGSDYGYWANFTSGNHWGVGYSANQSSAGTMMIGWNEANVFIGKGALIHNETISAINSSATATAAQMVGGYITSTSAASTTITTPTATALLTQINTANQTAGGQGTWFEFTIDNHSGANTVTLALDASITQLTVGPSSLTVPATSAGVGTWRVTFVSTSAAVISRIQ